MSPASRLLNNLERQVKGWQCLQGLLIEEFSFLMDRKPQNVAQVELSIQELLRQLAAEKEALHGLIKAEYPEARGLSEVLPACSPEDRIRLVQVADRVQGLEQACAKQAEKSGVLAQAMAEQTRALIGFLHQELFPVAENTYSKSGRFRNERSEAVMVHGRL